MEYMRQRGLLLGPEHKAATSGGGDCMISRCCRKPMPNPHRQPIRCAVQPLLSLEHIARREAFVAASVTPKCHQFRRGFHRRHDAVELLLPVAMPMYEHGEITRGERRL